MGHGGTCPHFYKRLGTGAVPSVAEQQTRNWPNCILTITKALTKTTNCNCTFRAKKWRGTTQLSNSFRRHSRKSIHYCMYTIFAFTVHYFNNQLTNSVCSAFTKSSRQKTWFQKFPTKDLIPQVCTRVFSTGSHPRNPWCARKVR